MSAAAPRSTGLGRGLAALIPSRTASLAAPAEIPIARIQASPYQPRKRVDEEALQTLAESIAQHGVLQPVLVTETLDGYRLIAGERRLRAAELAGLDRVPAVVRQLADQDQLELALVENIQRADLNPLEEAAAYRQLVDEFGLSQDDIARRVGRSRPSISNALRLLELSPAVQDAIRDGSITEGHARAIAGLESAADQDALLAVLVARGLSVRQAEELARRLKQRGEDPPRTPRSAQPVDPDIERIESELRTALGTKVNLARSRRGGRIVIEFYSDEDLSRLYDRLVGSPA